MPTKAPFTIEVFEYPGTDAIGRPIARYHATCNACTTLVEMAWCVAGARYAGWQAVMKATGDHKCDTLKVYATCWWLTRKISELQAYVWGYERVEQAWIELGEKPPASTAFKIILLQDVIKSLQELLTRLGDDKWTPNSKKNSSTLTSLSLSTLLGKSPGD